MPRLYLDLAMIPCKSSRTDCVELCFMLMQGSMFALNLLVVDERIQVVKGPEMDQSPCQQT